MRWVGYVVRMRGQKCVQNFSWENLGDLHRWKDIKMDHKETVYMRFWTGLNWF